MDDVEKIKQKIDIVELVGGYIALKKAGRNFKALCPFHSEKSPSFIVSAERQIWHCFGCGKGGDQFAFLMEYENISFPDALRDLADRAGVKLTGPLFRSEKEKLQEKIYALNHIAYQFYNYILLSHGAGKKALDYLVKKRGVTIPLIKTFCLGWAPSDNSLSQYLLNKKGYVEQDLIVSGLAYKKNGRLFDFFKNRIIFPISDARGNIVAFSGRVMVETPDQGPKYINTRETPVYVKSNSLFGLNLAREAIKKEGTALIVEGEFDVISSYKEGITNTVAVKGTALTEGQIRLLKRYTPKFLLSFDTDPAGTGAQRRSVELIEKEGVSASVVIPQKSKDPDELLRENPALFKKAVREAVGVYDFIIDSAVSEFDKKTSEGKKNILDKTLPYIIQIENEVIKEHYLKKLAEAVETSYDSLLKQADKSAVPKTFTQPASQKAQLPREEVIEIYLLSLIFQSKNPKTYLKKAREELYGIPLTTPALEKTLSFLEKFEQEGDFSIKNFLGLLPEALHVAFDTSYLAPVPEFENEEKHIREVQKVAQEIRLLSARKRLRGLSESIAKAEKDKDRKKLGEYNLEFEKLSKLLRPTAI